MSEERKKILEMLEAGIINQDDAVRLLEALGEAKGPAAPAAPSLTLYPDGPLTDAMEQVQKDLEEAAAEIPEPPVVPAAPEPPEPWNPEAFALLRTDGTPYGYPEIAGEKISSLHINWMTGPVEVRPGQDDTLKVTEYANRPLNDDEKLQMNLEDGELTIRWTSKQNWRGSFKTIMGLTKHLVVELPRSVGTLDEAEIANVSGDLFVRELTGDDMHLSTVSGQLNAVNLSGSDVTLTSVSGTVKAQNIAGNDLSFNTTSGKLEINGFEGKDTSLNTVSGKILTQGQGKDISANSVSGGVDLRLHELPGDLSVNTVSGRVSLGLPDKQMGFTVNYSTMSGNFKSDFPLSGRLGKKSGEASYGEGECDISFHTMSGAMEIRRV